MAYPTKATVYPLLRLRDRLPTRRAGMKHMSRRPTYADLATLLTTSTVLPPMMVGSSSASIRTKNEMNKLPWTTAKQKIQVRMRTQTSLTTRETHKGKPGEYQIEGLVQESDVDPQFSHKAVRRAIYVIELDRTIHRSKKRAIEPPATLQHQLGNLKGGSDQRIIP